MDRKEEKQKLPSFESIQAEIQNILETYDSADNDLGEYSLTLNEDQQAELDAYLEMLGTQEADKIDRFCQFIRIETEHAEDIKEESRRLARKAQTAQSRIDYIKARYLSIMQQHGVRKISGKVYTASVRESQAVAIENQAVIPAEFWKIKEERSVDKVMVKNSIKAGIEVPGCSLVPTYSLLTR